MSVDHEKRPWLLSGLMGTVLIVMYVLIYKVEWLLGWLDLKNSAVDELTLIRENRNLKITFYLMVVMLLLSYFIWGLQVSKL